MACRLTLWRHPGLLQRLESALNEIFGNTAGVTPQTQLARISHQGGKMIAQEFGFTEDFAKEWKNSLYSRLNKILREFKDQGRARQSGEECGPSRLR